MLIEWSSYHVKSIVQYLATITSSLVLVSSGMVRGWTSPSLPKLQESSEFSVTKDEGSWIVIVSLLGSVLIAPINTVIADRIGRKGTILLSTFPFFVSWITIAYSRSVLFLCIGRLIAGIAGGLVFIAVPAYLAETAVSNRRGLLETGIPAGVALGILLINLLGLYFDVTTTALVSSSLPLLTFVTFIWMPESPYYLLMTNNLKAAESSLKVLRGTEDVESELNRLRLAIEQQRSNKGSLSQLLSDKGNLKALGICVFCIIIQKFSGIDGIIFYNVSIFKDVHSNIAPEVCVALFASVQLITVLVSSTVVDRMGRKPFLIVSVIGCFITSLVEAIYFYYKSHYSLDSNSFAVVAAVALIGFTFFFSLGLGITPLAISSELFPTNVRVFALALLDAFFCTLTSAVGKLFQVITNYFGMQTPFFLSAICLVLGLVGIVYFVPETKGRTLEDIQLELRSENVKETQF